MTPNLAGWLAGWLTDCESVFFFLFCFVFEKNNKFVGFCKWQPRPSHTIPYRAMPYSYNITIKIKNMADIYKKKQKNPRKYYKEMLFTPSLSNKEITLLNKKKKRKKEEDIILKAVSGGYDKKTNSKHLYNLLSMCYNNNNNNNNGKPQEKKPTTKITKKDLHNLLSAADPNGH